MPSFASPYFFLLLGPLLYFLYFHKKSAHTGTMNFSNTGLLDGIQPTPKVLLYRSLPYLRFVGLLLLIIALARPQFGHTTFEVSHQGVDIMTAIDTSRSMTALDFKVKDEPVNRLEIVKSVIKDFVGKREFDRIGIIVFGDNAYTQSPLTLDHTLVRTFIDKVHIGMAGDATAIGSAIGVAIKRLKDLESKSKIVVLLTDGTNTAGQLSPIKAAEMAKQLKIKIYAIGVGSKGAVPLPVQTPFGVRYVRQQVPIDEKMLTEIAEITGGKYYRATDYEKLKGIYAEIDSLEKSEVKVKEFHNYVDRYLPFLIGGALLLLMELLTTLYLRKL